METTEATNELDPPSRFRNLLQFSEQVLGNTS